MKYFDIMSYLVFNFTINIFQLRGFCERHKNSPVILLNVHFFKIVYILIHLQGCF